MKGISSKLTAIAIVTALMAVPTGAIASSPTAPPAMVQQTATPAVNPWLTLSALTTSSAVTSAAAAATVQDDAYDTPSPWPAWVIIGLTAALAIWILVQDGDGDGLDFDDDEEPVSP